MSKYIRTKDERIVELEGLCWVDKTDEETKKLIPYCLFQIYEYPFVLTEIEILRQADTIEELCDEMVVINAGCKCLYKPSEIFGCQDKEAVEELIKNNLIYGAIWTDKGLIYVAKMDDKGELELL